MQREPKKKRQLYGDFFALYKFNNQSINQRQSLKVKQFRTRRRAMVNLKKNDKETEENQNHLNKPFSSSSACWGSVVV
jgi:hypothetical protein